MHLNPIKEQSLCPRGRYYGSPTQEDIIFNTKLQEIAQRLAVLSALHTRGKLSSPQALAQVEQIWQGFREEEPWRNNLSQPGLWS